MSTTRWAVLAVLVACSSKKSATPPAATCLPGEISSTGAGIASVDGVIAHACWGDRCLTLNRDGKATGPAEVAATEAGRRAAADALRPSAAVPASLEAGLRTSATSPSSKRLTVFYADKVVSWDLTAKAVVASYPTTVEAAEAQHLGDTHVMFRGAGGQAWTLLDLVTGVTTTAGEPGWDLTVIDAASAAVFKGNKLAVVDGKTMTVTTPFTMPGRVAMATAWFDRILVVLDHPAATAQIDPKTGSLYAGPALPICK